jgi:hypothetical protein
VQDVFVSADGPGLCTNTAVIVSSNALPDWDAASVTITGGTGALDSTGRFAASAGTGGPARLSLAGDLRDWLKTLLTLFRQRFFGFG